MENNAETPNFGSIEKLLNKTEDKLLLQWYDEQLKNEVGGSADDLVGTIDDLREAFLNWAEEVQLKEKICGKWDRYALAENNQRKVHLVLAVSELIASIQGIHVPVTIAVIIVQWGGAKLCHGQ